MTSIRDDGPGSLLAEARGCVADLQLRHEALAARYDELELVLAAGRVGFCRLDTRSGAISASTLFKAEFGLAPDAQLDWDALRTRIQKDDRERLTIAAYAASEHGAQVDVVVRAEWPESGVQFVALRGRCIRDAADAAAILIITSRNVSAEALAMQDEERARSAAIDRERRLRLGAENANRAKDEFLSVISHELRSPLNAILGWNRILALKCAADPEVAKIAPRIEQGAKAQLKMVNDLLDLGRIGTGRLRIEPRPLRLSKIVAAAVELARPAAQKKGIEIVTELQDGIARIRGDAERLQQVVANLVSNAIKFMPGPGRISVMLRESAQFQELQVTDAGQGIAPELLPHVFDRFLQGDSSSTRSCSGLGLGLTLVKELVALHGGTVSARSPGVGCGATFVVSLPTSQNRTALGKHSLQGLSILVVDDELDARTIVAETLRLEGADVTVCDCVAQALKHLHSAGTRFDIVVTDIGMPDEDGYSLVRKLRALESNHRTLAIAVTGYASRSDVETALSAGFDVHVPKPVDFDAFVGIVQRLAVPGETQLAVEG